MIKNFVISNYVIAGMMILGVLMLLYAAINTWKTSKFLGIFFILLAAALGYFVYSVYGILFTGII